MAVLGRLDADPLQRAVGGLGGSGDLGRRTHQNGVDEALVMGLDGGGQRLGIAGVDDGDRQRRRSLGCCHEAFEAPGQPGGDDDFVHG
jgi:hypothetical protein